MPSPTNNDQISQLNEKIKNCNKINSKLKKKIECLEGENSRAVILTENLKFYSYWIIHFSITGLFILLTAMTVYKVGSNFYSDFSEQSYYSQETIDLVKNEVILDSDQLKKIDEIVITNNDRFKSYEAIQKAKELKLLSKIEHIFIYLIPLLLLIGFYFYYHFNYGNYFEGSTPSPKDIGLAKDSLKLTKTLFLSSIMSYVIIKIIENTLLSEGEVSVKMLVSYGVLLFLLMTYLIMSHKGEHKEGQGYRSK